MSYESQQSAEEPEQRTGIVFSLTNYLKPKASKCETSEQLETAQAMLSVLLSSEDYDLENIAQAMGVSVKALEHMRLGICCQAVQERAFERLQNLYDAAMNSGGSQQALG